MKRMLINATQQEELRVALVDGQRLYDLDIESPGHEQKKANIYKGKITRIEPSLEAAFVDYGAERHGFLPLKEIAREYFPANYNAHGRPNIKDVLREGQEVIVQIDKEERGNKGAALTTFISLAGSYLVLMPNNPRAGGISRRIEGDDRTELKEALASLELPDGMGLIVRTAGVGKSAEALQWDLSFRLKHWEAIQKAAESRPAPFLIHQESNVIVRAFRDYLRQDIGEILIDNPKVLELARQHIAALGRPDFSSKIKLYTGEIPLFSHYQIESQIESAFQREVRLPSGGSIVIDSTEALTAIDINSARATRGGDIEETAFNTNLEAADEIARQLRLRDLGGLIVIDFIDMTPVRHQRAVENRLREAVRQDRARIQISHISRFGLLEMSRQRLSPSLGESSHHVCPRCSGTGTVRDNESLSLSILRLIEEEALKENTQEVHAIVPVPIASYLLNEKRTAVNAIETRQDGVRCVIVPNDQMETPHYSVLRVRKGEETPTLSYMLPKLHEEAMALPSEEEFAERKRPEQPALATFAMPEVPPAPTPAEPPVKAAASKAAVAPAAPAEPGLLSRFFGALKSLFSGSEDVKPAEQPAPKAAEKPERQQDRRKRQNNRRDRNDRNERRDNRDNRGERSENGENRDENRRNRRNAQQNAENRDNRQQATDVADKAKSGDEQQQQQPRRERNRRRSDDKRQAQQEVKALNLDEQQTPETEQEERVRQAQPRRKQRQLNQKVRYHDQASEVAEVETATTEENVVAPVAAQAAPAQSTELVKVPLPVVTEATPEQDDNGEARDNAGMPRRSRRSPRHLRVSGQRRRRYRDERYPLQSPMPLTVACASPEMASGKVWIRYPVARPQDAQPEAQEIEQVQAQPVVTEPQAVAAAVEAVAAVEPAVETVVETVTEAPVQAEAVVETTHPEVIAAPVVEQPQVIADADVPVAEEVAAQAEPVAETQETAPVVEETPDVVTVEPETMTVVPDVVAAEPVAVEPEVVAEPEVIAEPVAAPVIAEAPTAPAPVSEPVVVAPIAEAAAPVVAEPVAEHSHATAPMTRAPAPEYVPEAPRHSDWQRPAFAFDGKGAAGGHTASHSASAGPTRPQPVE
ncbi:ribonuclease E [Citrobacter amalonaticus]|uniref:Ribonuclease E n=1 Tax=Citrobacter amalonaticus TaxID=35703 RepID=A0AAW9LYY0_CITAM|nr:ribonuclease E [Citrobacter amalonaticus]MDV2135743.1 ribonuclease E [Citrobacter amalonaticus]MEB0583249.1 ribonuclease E [Citrobacter amalonaticus]SAZ69178.1 fused ribonucleaseE: endoribonuclease; RNA-binding protein; RNA degradosome binding protein [Citrobacter amalonaticus]SAZ85600.1 fused ribonucleaseE: endoribonuclease; RNA-binding protein; RNA degradosome binding protein [Citrobacter amalonaticus]